ARAELLAAAAGVKLGRVLSISEGSTPTDPVPMFRAEASAAPVPVAGGELGLSANVTILYQIVE
ncbi:MAG: SIMPL domain-containing protein, partial [Rhodobacteraceae bacterium]|nr:SIMPL domain-containing protein [Paracoccaceae bacterium]